MPALDIGFSQVKMASIAPQMAPTTLTMKRSHLPEQANGSLAPFIASAKSCHLMLEQPPFKKRRFQPTSSPIFPNPNNPKGPVSPPVTFDLSEDSSSSSSSSSYGGNDLTNLNWLQDSNLLRNVLSETLDAGKAGMLPPQMEAPNEEGKVSTCAQVRQGQVSFQTKPPYSYSALIFMAIESSPNKSMLVRDIYSWIAHHFPYFNSAPAGWKNTIRHTLSLRKCFRKKVDGANGSATSEPTPCTADNDSDSGDIKGGHWYVDEFARPSLQAIVERAHKGMTPNGGGRGKAPVKEGVCSLNLARLWPANLRVGEEKPKLLSLSAQRFIQVPVIQSFSQSRVRSPRQGAVPSKWTVPSSPWVPPVDQAATSYNFHLTLHNQVVNQRRRSRNTVSMISVNQTPKVYAPVPKATPPKRRDTLSLAHFAKHLTAEPHTPNDLMRGKAAQPGTRGHLEKGGTRRNAAVSRSNRGVLNGPENDEHAGAQALLNFATTAFQLNRFIKQED